MPAFAGSEPQRYAVVGRGLIFALAAPAGWKMDTIAGEKDGLPVVFYPVGKTWSGDQTAIYANTAPKACEPTPDLKSFISQDLRESKQRDPGLVVGDLGTMNVDGLTTVLKKLTGDRHGNVEAIAYVDATDTFVSIILSAKSAQEFKASYAAFRAVVSSFQSVVSSPGCNCD